MLLTLGLGALIGGIGGAIIKSANQYGTNAQQQQYDLQKAQQQYQYDSALSAQNAQQELAKQQDQQTWEKMMSDTTNQREVADMKAAGINPALAGGGVSSTNAQAASPSAETPAPQQTNARQNAKQVKKDLITTLQTAYASGVLKQASEQLETMGKKLAKQPKNINLKKQMDSYTRKVYSLLV